MIILRPGIQLLLLATPILWSFSFIPPAALRAAGDVKFEMLVSMGGMIFVRVVLAYVLGVVLGMGVMGVWLGMYADWVFRGILLMLRVKSNKWRPKPTSPNP